MTFYAIWQQLKPSIQTNFRETISPEQRLAVTLWLLGTTAEQRTVAHFFGIAHSTVCEIVQDTPAAIVQQLLPIYIKFPEDSNLQKVVDRFYTKWSIPQCAGAIDGSHIPIKPPAENHTDYYNRKGWQSKPLIIVQHLYSNIFSHSWST